MTLTPDRKLFTKAVMILTSLTVLLLLCGLIAQILVWIFADASDLGVAAAIIWGSSGGVAAMLWAIATPISWLWIRNLSYVLEPDKVVIHKGILTKITQNIPYRMITDFRLNRSLFDRWLGIGSIDIQTAGQTQTATGYEGRIAGMAHWEDLHVDLRSRIEHLDHEAPRAEDDDMHAIRREVEEIHRLLDRASG